MWKAVLCVIAARRCCGVRCAVSYNARISAENDVAMQASFAREEARHIQQQMVLFTDAAVPARLPFHVFLQGLGIAPDVAARLIASAQSVFDFRHVRAGNHISVGRSILGDLREVRYRIDADRVLNIAPQGNDFRSEIQTIPSQTKTVGVTGEIRGSLFNAVTDAGEKPELAMRLADIFGWDLDFYTDPRPGDTFRVVVEKKMLANGERCFLRTHSRRGIRQRQSSLSRRAVSRSRRSAGLLHARRQIHEEGVSAFAAEIRRGDYLAFQRASLSSHLEGIPPASGD